MGCKSSKSGDEEDKDDDEFTASLISFNGSGNLVHNGPQCSVEQREDQLKFFSSTSADDSNEEVEGKRWVVMDASWITCWLAYAHFDRDVSPAPGPCKNHRLLQPDFTNNKWKPRNDLVMANVTSQGDYRRVTETVWKRFAKDFPGSGPKITMIYSTKNLDKDEVKRGRFPIDENVWEIEETVPFESEIKSLYGEKWVREERENQKLAQARKAREKDDSVQEIDYNATAAVEIKQENGVLNVAKGGGGLQLKSTQLSNGLMEDLSVTNSLRDRGKNFLSTGNDAIPKARMNSKLNNMPPLSASSSVPTSSSATQAVPGFAPKAPVDSGTDGTYRPMPPTPPKQNGQEQGISMAALGASKDRGVNKDENFPHEQFFSDEHN